jgi:hypothetical protein
MVEPQMKGSVWSELAVIEGEEIAKETRHPSRLLAAYQAG